MGLPIFLFLLYPCVLKPKMLLSLSYHHRTGIAAPVNLPCAFKTHSSLGKKMVATPHMNSLYLVGHRIFGMDLFIMTPIHSKSTGHKLL